MSDYKPHSGRVSRRDFLFVTAAGSGAIIGAGIIAAPARAATKFPQKRVAYQPTPKGNQRCDNCTFWEPPASCKLVQDPIAASGWCTLYQKK